MINETCSTIQLHKGYYATAVKHFNNNCGTGNRNHTEHTLHTAVTLNTNYIMKGTVISLDYAVFIEQHDLQNHMCDFGVCFRVAQLK